MAVDPGIFRAYDIRGVVGSQITPDGVRLIARAYATRFVERDNPTLAISRDLRTSSEELAAAAVEGILAAGVNVVDVGQAPTPGLYFAIGIWGLDGGMGITASHRPPSDNGIKVRGGKPGELGDGPFFGEDLQALKEEVLAGRFASGSGAYEQRDFYPEYFRLALERLSIARPMKVALDLGNGAGTLTAPRLLRELGCELTTLFEEPDGTFPGRGPDPTHPGAMEPLRAAVLETGAELGIAIDADGDRIAVVDHTGQVIEPDQYMLPICREALASGPGTIVSEVRCSQSICDDVVNHGGDMDLVAVGYPFILKAMREHNSPVGFETSGHCYFGDSMFKFDDASFGAARLLGTLSRGDQSMREIVDSAPRYYPAEPPRIACPDDRKFGVVAAVADAYRATHAINERDGVRAQYEDGWAVLRASNTGPELVLRWEGRTPEARDRIGEDLMQRLHGVPAGA
jgi:phosphomannomutase/phosphoglucomutase